VRAFAQALASWDGGAAAAAPVINRFTDAFAVWNGDDMVAVPGANAASREARAFAAILRLSLWFATAPSRVARDISSCHLAISTLACRFCPSVRRSTSVERAHS
jgi:hypothetical protein